MLLLAAIGLWLGALALIGIVQARFNRHELWQEALISCSLFLAFGGGLRAYAEFTGMDRAELVRWESLGAVVVGLWLTTIFLEWWIRYRHGYYASPEHEHDAEQP